MNSLNIELYLAYHIKFHCLLRFPYTVYSLISLIVVLNVPLNFCGPPKKECRLYYTFSFPVFRYYASLVPVEYPY